MILLTGATGIVGSHVLIELLKKGEKVRVLKRAGSSTQAIDQLLKYHQLSKNSFEIVDGDINDLVSLSDASEDCESIYHCAAMVSFNPADADKLHKANVVGTKNVVDTCLAKSIKTLAYVSSTAAIGGQLINGMQNESSEWVSDKGKSDYTLSKRYAEMEAWRGAQEGLNVAIVNPAVIIGPGKWGQSSTTLFQSAKKGLKVYSSGSNGFVDARDIAEILIDLVEKKVFSERFLLVGEHLPFKGFFERLSPRFGNSGPKLKMPKAPVLWFAGVLNHFEKLGVCLPGITSENMKSAYRNVHYDTAKIKALGYEFRPLEESFDYSLKVQEMN